MLELGSTTEGSFVYVFRTYQLSALRRISPVGRRGRQGVEAVSPQPLCNTPDGFRVGFRDSDQRAQLVVGGISRQIGMVLVG